MSLLTHCNEKQVQQTAEVVSKLFYYRCVFNILRATFPHSELLTCAVQSEVNISVFVISAWFLWKRDLFILPYQKKMQCMGSDADGF